MSNNQTVLITGASAGIGKETAKQLIDRGYSVYAAARRTESMKDLGNLGATVIGMDVTKEADVQTTVQQISDERGGIDVLINNAGCADQGAMEDTSPEDARAMFDVNVFGLARLTQLALPYMREKGDGRIINVSSAGGRLYIPLCSWYIASKHAVEGFSDCLRNELAPFGIKVVIIEPGAIQTEFEDVSLRKTAERSGSGPYADMVRSFLRMNADLGGSHPSVIADVILEAIEAKKPKARYVAGKLAKTTIRTRRWLGDGAYDRLIASMMK